MHPFIDVTPDKFIARWVRAIERAAFHDGRSFLFGLEPLADKSLKYVLHDADGKIRTVLRTRHRRGFKSARWGKIGAEEARAVIVPAITSSLARDPTTRALSPTSLEFARERIRQVQATMPELTRHGFGVWKLPNEPGYALEFGKYRAEMLSDEACVEFVTACEWLFRQPKTAHINRQCGSSYGLKHDAERWANQHIGMFQSISNGMFIAAAIACGLQVARIRNGPNARLNLSNRRSTEAPKYRSRRWRGGFD